MNEQELKKAAKEVLPSVDVVIGQRAGFDPLHAEPCFATKPEDVDDLIASPLCVHNLASYLPSLKGKKVAVVVKGCDSRTVVQFLEEGLIKRENVTVIGVPCSGIISVKKVLERVNHEPIQSISFDNETVTVKTNKREEKIPLLEVAPGKCKTCQYPNPLIFDVLVGQKLEPRGSADAVYDDIREFETKTLEERKEYWEKTLGRCIRCYACRNACPLCVCQESCIAETRDPHWMSQKSEPKEKMMFHMIHAIHLAGRCTECGECERVCPMDIPLGQLKKKINMGMKDLYDYIPGTNPEEKPPMYVFKVEEDKIEEHELS